MPIRPENRARYPANWKEIRERILKRAHYRCEWEGCRAGHHDIGWWSGEEFQFRSRAMREAGCEAGDIIDCADGSTIKLIKIVLTIAHLDHVPEHCDDENLRAWCQRHHLRYDAAHHAETARATRRARKAIGDLFEA